ncbi:MAG: DNA methyltransferase [Planctomycetota bacterium]
MPLDFREIKQRAIAFSREWSDAAKENAESQTFWNEFFAVFGKSRKAVATFEESVQSLGGTAHRIDLFWPGRLIGESKSRGQDLKKAHAQAVGYIADLINNGREDEVPRYILVTDFAHIAVHDLDPDNPNDLFDFTADATVQFPLRDLHQHIRRFGFIAGYDTQTLDPEDPANIVAAERLANVHDRLEDSGYAGHDLQRFMVRVLFCLFAEDTGIFEPDAFKQFIQNHTKPDGSDLGPQLARLFQTLNNPRDRRQAHLPADLAELPYVNGRLFEEQLAFADFSAAMRESLLVAAGFRWDTISPAVFGSLFQSIMEPKARRQIGAHYTSERDILKLIRSLFLDRLTDRLNRCAAPRDYNAFLDHLRSLRFLDPACGCGNFLVIAFRELRRLEMDALNQLAQRESGGTLGLGQSQIPVSHFYGIEIEEWPALIAEVAMWLMDHQLNNEQFAKFGTATPTVPLQQSPGIRCANALTTDWNDVLPADECSYVMGNPPFIGKKEQTKAQKSELQDAWHPLTKGVSNLDYVSAWYAKAADYFDPGDTPEPLENPRRAAFVSTNSITQGEQVGIMWPELFRRRIEIEFGHRTFPWTSEARGKAHVHVVVVGFGYGQRSGTKRIYDYDKKGESLGVVEVSNVSPYLADGPNLTVAMRSKPISRAPRMRYGSMMIDKDRKHSDDYGLILNDESRQNIINECPEAEPYIRVLYGGEEYINSDRRHCLWLVDAPVALLRGCDEIRRRVEGVRVFREGSSRTRTQELARTPHLFGEIRQPSERYLLVPKVSSENRDYIPIGFVDPSIVASGSALIVPEADLYTFGILSSAMHMAWVNPVCGRMKSDYQYSARLVYNNFPWPYAECEDCGITAKQREAVERAGRAVLDAREPHLSGGATLADLYDPLAMPADLAKAHVGLDRAVDRCYRPQPFPDERRRFEFLFARYERLTASLMAGATKKKRGRRRSG